jgi:hypothetical protein
MLSRYPFELMMSSRTPTHGPYGFETEQAAARAATTFTRTLPYLLRTSPLWVYVTERGRSGYWGVHFLLGGVTLWDHVAHGRRRPGQCAPLSLARQAWALHHGTPHTRLVTNVEEAVAYITKHAGHGHDRFGDLTACDDLLRWRDRPGVLWAAPTALIAHDLGLPSAVPTPPSAALGANARAAAMSKEQHSAHGRMMARARWAKRDRDRLRLSGDGG